jgi:two-component system, OmpR family, sensor histidine kinase KdpD
MTGLWRSGRPAPFALLTAYAALFVVGTVAAGLHGRLSATGVLIASAAVVTVFAYLAEPLAMVPLAAVGWLTAVGFSGPPYASLHSGPAAVHALVVVGACALAGTSLGLLHRSAPARLILGSVSPPEAGQPGSRPRGGDADQAAAGLPAAERGPVAAKLPEAIGVRRQISGVLLGLAGMPTLTAVLTAVRPHLTLTDDLLIYLVAVVALAVIGGFWPAVLAAAAASLLLNWYFTPPLHTFTIERPENLLALLLFVTVAVAVSSVVHLAARRAVQADRNREEANSLLALAQTVLGGSDTPAAILDHLVETFGGYAELQEQVSGSWVKIAASGKAPADLAGPADPAGPATSRVDLRADLALEVTGQLSSMTPGLLAGFGAQAAAALDRERLRTQAAQAEALEEGNRMRTALLAAVSHDLRTPLASIKASVSSLRQSDVRWSAADQEALLATIEQNADRLDGLIGNLLDMSRVHTRSLQPFLRPTTIDEVAPIALRGLDESGHVRLMVPDGLPLVLADPGLLERVLANLFSNALKHSPPASPPALRAYRLGEDVVLEVVDRGPGVPDQLKERIFEPFQRFDGRKAGVGLGLAVAKGFTEAMGGSIAAADTPDGGLTIRLTLPMADSKAESALGAEP